MKTVEHEVFSFDELSKEAQQKAIEINHDINVEYWEWWCHVYDQYTEKLEAYGYNDVEMWFSGFWSQGDGACFDASVDLAKVIEKNKLKTKFRDVYRLAKDGLANASIIKNGYATYYNHERTRYISLDLELWHEDITKEKEEKLWQQTNELENILEEHRLQFCIELYKDLQNEYEWRTEDANIAETLIINEYTFLPNGKMVNW